MNLSTKFGLCGLAAAWLGCADLATDEPTAAGAPGAGALLPTLHADDGAPAPAGGFAAKEAVYLRTALLDPDLPLPGGDLAFAVVGPDGAELTSDPLGCRRLRVDPDTGAIVAVPGGLDVTGAPCRRAWRADASGRGLLVQLAPYADAAPDAAGRMELAVLVAPAADMAGERLPAGAPRATFVVQAPPRDPTEP